uniref:Uncharacterized protein n=1 Tax=Brassica campestris TaxID=3711 RepID=A0A3P6CS85_BRACM|nr:unnamed protein product [Brassica rapa]
MRPRLQKRSLCLTMWLLRLREPRPVTTGNPMNNSGYS